MGKQGWGFRAQGIFLSITILSQMAWGWGRDGHELVASVGVQSANVGSQFWNANRQNIVKLSTVPDFLWKRTDTYRPESPTHFFQPDFYFKDPNQFKLIPRDFEALVQKVGLETAVKEGTTPWRINQFYNLAVIALKNRDYRTAVVMAGVMAHYIGDLSQPLHVTENYDGQQTNNVGIHKFFETTNVRNNLAVLTQVVPLAAQKLLIDPNFRNQFKGSVIDVSFNEMLRAYSYKDLLIKTDRDQGRTGQGSISQLNIARNRLADGAATFALILSHLWEEGGQKDTGATGDIQAPNWIQPNYYSASSVNYRTVQTPQACFNKPQFLDDDCH